MNKRPLLIDDGGAAGADGHGDGGDGRIGRDDLAERLLRCIISAKEMSCAASDVPEIRPVSCCGKKPLGMMMNREAVSARVAKKTMSVTNWWRSTTSRPSA